MTTPVTLSKKYTRPSLIIFCNSMPVKNPSNPNQWTFTTTPLYLTDDNRAPLQFNSERIEYRKRMIDGTMRSYHVADKLSYSTSWTSLPSRKTRNPTASDGLTNSITSDAFGAGIDIKNWYETVTGDFWMLLVYDTDNTVSTSNLRFNADLHHVFFESFDYSVSKRGQFNDLWDVSISLVEA
jgi:hypothetical protein